MLRVVRRMDFNCVHARMCMCASVHKMYFVLHLIDSNSSGNRINKWNRTIVGAIIILIYICAVHKNIHKWIYHSAVDLLLYSHSKRRGKHCYNFVQKQSTFHYDFLCVTHTHTHIAFNSLKTYSKMYKIYWNFIQIQS